MAPFCADPRQIVIALEPQRRIELLKLVDDIIFTMTAQLQAKPEDLGSVSMESSIYEESHSPPQNEKSLGTPTSTDAVKTEASSDSITLFDAEDLQQASNSDTANADGKKTFNPPNPFKNVKIGVPWKTNPNTPSRKTRRAEEVQSAARQYIEEWEHEFVPKLEEIVRVKENDKIIQERKTRRQAVELNEENERAERKRLADSNEARDEEAAFTVMQKLYPPLPTSLINDLSVHDRREAISCVLLLLLSTGKYSGHSRALMMSLTSSLDIPHTFLNKEEAEISESLIEQSTKDANQKESMSAEAEAAKRRQENKFGRYWKVGLASVAGATIIGVTGGLAAPLVAGAVGSILGGVGLGGVASFLGIFWMNGALVGALFGAYGAKMTVRISSLSPLVNYKERNANCNTQGSMMDKYAREVEDFKFIPLHKPPSPENGTTAAAAQNSKDRRLRLTLGVNGWLNSPDDITKPWTVLPSDTEVFALRYEMKTLLDLGTALGDLVKSFAWKAFKAEIIKRTVLATLWAALWPIQVLALASNVDNPFNHASNRSKKAGRLLADALINRVQGERPVTLIGYSLGAVAIHACLQSLAERRAFGLIDTVVIIGAPTPSDPAHWRTLRTVVSGKIFNAYSENDMVLGYVYRMHSLSLGVAGLQPITGVYGVENLNLSDRVSGHLRYPDLIGGILRECGFAGVKVEEEIEKDDVIVLKDEYAAGHAVDVDGELVVPDKSSSDAGDVTTAQSLPVDEGGQADEDVPPPMPRRPVKVASGDANDVDEAIAQRTATLHVSEKRLEEDVPPPMPKRPVKTPGDMDRLRTVEQPKLLRKPVAGAASAPATSKRGEDEDE